MLTEHISSLFIYLFIRYVGPLFLPGLLIYIKRAELIVRHFKNSNHWKRTLKMIFKGSGCFQFPEAVVTSAANTLLNADHYKLSLFYRMGNSRVQL